MMPTEVTFTPWRFWMALDNHEPYPRKDMGGTMERYIHPVTGKAGIRFTGEDAKFFFRKRNCLILVDDGKTVEPHWNSSYNEKDGYALFQPFPTSTNSPTSSYDGMPIDWSSWMMGPRKAFHLKVQPVQD